MLAVESRAANRTDEDSEEEGPAVTEDSCPVELGKVVYAQNQGAVRA